MRIGPSLVALGALLVLLGYGALDGVVAGLTGGATAPLFELELAGIFVRGWDLALVQAAGLLAAVSAAATLAGLRARGATAKKAALTQVLFGGTVLAVTLIVHADGAALVARSHGELLAGETLRPVEGFAFAYLGAACLLLGGLVLHAAAPSRVAARLRRRSLRALPWDLVGATAVAAVIQVGILLAALFLWEEPAVRATPRDGSAPPLIVAAKVVTRQPPVRGPTDDDGALHVRERPRETAQKPGGRK